MLLIAIKMQRYHEDEISFAGMLSKEPEETYPTRLHATIGAYDVVKKTNKDIDKNDKFEVYRG